MMGAAGGSGRARTATVAGVALGWRRAGVSSQRRLGDASHPRAPGRGRLVVYFWPRKLGAFGSRVSVGAPTDYQVGDVKYFVDGKFYLVRLEEGFMALYQKCVHLGCSRALAPGRGAAVEGRQSGACSSAPATAPPTCEPAPSSRARAPALDYMPVSLEDGRLLVATGAVRKGGGAPRKPSESTRHRDSRRARGCPLWLLCQRACSPPSPPFTWDTGA